MKNFIFISALCATNSHLLFAAGLTNLQKPNVFNYSFIEGGFLHRETSGNGININASFDIKPNIAVIGSINYTTQDNADYTLVSAGAAYHQQIFNDQIPNLDLLVHAQLEESFTTIHQSNQSDFGIRLGGGVRYLIVTELEAFGDLSLATTAGSSIFIKGGIRYALSNNLVAVASYEFSDDDSLMLGVRYYL